MQGTGSGTDADPCATTNCASATECTYTATVDPFAGPTGYFKFAECGDVANPVIVMKRGVTYTFDQSDNSNWYHPLGFAYFVDGAHNEVDELEPGITQTGDACAGTNTCQAPMYYKDGVLAGAAGYDNTLATPTGGEDFGLDAYEPEFFHRKSDWTATTYSSRVTSPFSSPATTRIFGITQPSASSMPMLSKMKGSKPGTVTVAFRQKIRLKPRSTGGKTKHGWTGSEVSSWSSVDHDKASIKGASTPIVVRVPIPPICRD